MPFRIRPRRDTASNWSAANPVLAEGEMAFESQLGGTFLMKVGDGTTAWNDLPYSPIRGLDEATIVLMENQASIPVAPLQGFTKVYARSIAGKSTLQYIGPSGLSTPLQPSFFQNNILLINANATSSITSIGNSVTTVGTISHPVATDQYGHMANFVTAATAAATAGTGNNSAMWARGGPGALCSGFFFSARLAFPDSSYDESGSGSGTRFFAGLTSGALAASVGATVPTGDYCGFNRQRVNGGLLDDNFFFMTRNNVETTRIDTGVPFVAEKVYDFYIFCAPQGTEVFWRLDNITDGTSFSGSTGQTLPTSTTRMRMGFQIQTVNAVARNIRMQRVYGESDV